MNTQCPQCHQNIDLHVHASYGLFCYSFVELDCTQEVEVWYYLKEAQHGISFGQQG